MFDSDKEERVLEVATGVGGFAGTGLLLQWAGRSNCLSSSATPDILGRFPPPPPPWNDFMCAMGDTNDNVMAWGLAALIAVGGVAFWEVHFFLERRR